MQRPPGNRGILIVMFVNGIVDKKNPFKGIDAGFPIHALYHGNPGDTILIFIDQLV
jgi:hypothetical protein